MLPASGPISQYENPLENYDNVGLIYDKIDGMSIETMRSACKFLHLFKKKKKHDAFEEMVNTQKDQLKPRTSSY